VIKRRISKKLNETVVESARRRIMLTREKIQAKKIIILNLMFAHKN